MDRAFGSIIYRGASTVWRGDCTDLYSETIQGGAFLPYRTMINIVINIPGGSVNFDILVMKINSYSIAQIFEKDLYFLLPFHIFNLEKNFPKYPKYESPPAELEKLKRVYTDFMTRSEQAVKDGKIFYS